jgi:hypothetical protein
MQTISTGADIHKQYAKHISTKNKIIQKALDYSYTMLSIKKFKEVTRFEMPDVLSADLMWNTFKLGIPVYITEELIRAFGYKGELKKQTQLLLNLVNKHNIPIIKLDNKEYARFTGTLQSTPNDPASPDTSESDSENSNSSEQPEYDISDDDKRSEADLPKFNKLNLVDLYPAVTKKQLKSKPWHHLIMPNDLKRLLLVVNTENGDRTRDYVIKLDELFHVYTEYQLRFENRTYAELDKKYQRDTELAEIRHRELISHIDELNDNIESLSDKLENTADRSVPLTKDKYKLERFILVKLNDDDPDSYDYYVIRAQRLTANVAFRKLRRNYPNCLKQLVFEYQPNSINLYNRIKERLGDNIVYEGNYLSPNGISHAKLIKRFKKIHEERNDIE